MVLNILHTLLFLLVTIKPYTSSGWGNWWKRGAYRKFIHKAAATAATRPLKNYCIVDCNTGAKYCGNNQIKQYGAAVSLENKKLITISPGGFKGFYMLGVVTYIKTFFNITDEFLFSGSSAGSWNALVMSYNGEPYTLYPRIRKIIGTVNGEFKKTTIFNTQKQLRAAILEKFDDREFNLTKIYIGVTTGGGVVGGCTPGFLSKFARKTHIYNNFANLDEAVDACMASSHIPFITGNHKYRFREIDAYDGGFSKYPYLAGVEPYLKITPNIWGAENESLGLESFTTLFSKHKYDLVELFETGFLDSFENHDKLARLFLATGPPGGENEK
jgi:hypothetical protein